MALAFVIDLPVSVLILLVICLLAVCFFEAINGFHDTANAVATVIYTNSLKPMTAVIWSGFCNFLGAFLGPAFFVWLFLSMFGAADSLPSSNIGVAMGILKLVEQGKLVPQNDLMTLAIGENVAFVLAILLASIVWNFGTWYYGIPSSSSHTLIGSLLGGGFALWSIHGGTGPNWSKATDIGLSLLVSPVFGFSLTVLLMYILKATIRKSKKIFDEPSKKKSPPVWIRAILIATCTLVSFFHGSNDGQKGVGLLLVVLMAFLPMQFAINSNITAEQIKTAATSIQTTLAQAPSAEHPEIVAVMSNASAKMIAQADSLDRNNRDDAYTLRKSLQAYTKNTDTQLKLAGLPKGSVRAIESNLKEIKAAYEYAPTWAIFLISLCLGIGTMVGWKRIVVTIGEKIGKSHLSYAQGASAELCASITIGLSTAYSLPVSTTHVLSSGIAGSMVASGGIKNLQKGTIKNIAMAWVLTLPVTFALAALLFYLLRLVF
jgi:PiT family inorganic phosphate transporter